MNDMEIKRVANNVGHECKKLGINPCFYFSLLGICTSLIHWLPQLLQSVPFHRRGFLCRLQSPLVPNFRTHRCLSLNPFSLRPTLDAFSKGLVCYDGSVRLADIKKLNSVRRKHYLNDVFSQFIFLQINQCF